MKNRLFLWIVPACMCFAGCLGRSSQSGSADPAMPRSTDVSLSDALPAGPAHEVGADNGTVCQDSMLFGEGCTEYTGYFVSGSLDEEAVQNIRRVIFEGALLVDTDFGDCEDIESANRYREQQRDNLSALAWLDYEPWTEIRKLFVSWAEQQLDRAYIVFRSRNDPAYLYDCSEADSVLVRCADIMTEGGEGYVGGVRRLWKASPFSSLVRIDDELSGPDSVDRARERLLQFLSNHINHKIHSRLGEDGTVDFYQYEPDFLRLFDSVKVETFEP